MNGVIVNYRISRHVQKPKYMVVIPEGAKNRTESAKLVGKSVTYNTGKKDMVGKITSAHGNSGAVRVHFEVGLPGQSIGKKVSIN